MSQAVHTLDRIFRDESGPVLATLIRVLGDFQLAEDALQDALVAALATWPRDGFPASPGAWLTTTARRKALDRIRHLRIAEAKHGELALSIRLDHQPWRPPDDVDVHPVPDDQLRLIFTCCHPALALEAQVALTLQALGGLQIAEIARAFLVSEPTIAQRLSRAKHKIARAGIPYAIPDRASLSPRLGAVLSVLYLIFNEGYLATRALVRGDLVTDAIRMARSLAELLPEEPEATGLLSLMLLHDSRRDARADDEGELTLLADQDRTKWDRAQIDEGLRLVEKALHMRRPGRYQIQAAIAAVHAEAPSAAATDWPQIAVLYQQLLRYERSPVIELNRAVALSFVAGPAEGLAQIDAIVGGESLQRYAPFHLARADMLRRLGREGEARDSYVSALPWAPNDHVRRFIERQLTTRAP